MKNFRRFLVTFIKPYNRSVTLATLLMAFHTLLLMPTPFLTCFFLDYVIPSKSPPLLFMTLFLFIIVHLIRGTTLFTLQYVVSFLGERVVFNIRFTLHEKLQKLQMGFYDQRLTGQIIARVINDVNTIHHMLTGGFITILTDVLMIFIVTAILFSFNAVLAIAVLITLPFYAINFQLFVKKIRHINKLIREKVSEIYGYLAERISAIRIVRCFTREEYEQGIFSQKINTHLKLNLTNNLLNTALWVIASLIAGAGTAFVIWYGGKLISQNYLTLGTLIAFYSFIGYLYGPIIRLTQINTLINQVIVSIDRIFGILDEPVKIGDRYDARRIAMTEGRIIFENVSFSYRDAGHQVLDKINLEIKSGEKIGIVGPSGSGKTTLLQLISRLYDVSGGRILLDGNDIRDIKITSLRKNIGLVSQEITIFSGTISSNIQYGWKLAKWNDIREAARRSHLEEFIESLPDQYNTIVGEKGIDLSGGQKQRLALARALVRNPKILLLDDYLSSLDTTTEMNIRKMMEEIIKPMTCIIVSHRLSAIMKADRIYVLKDGRIIEQGNHSELLKRDGYYARLYYEQSKGVKAGII